jgi:DNA-binding XRE family transcriptional regulator
MNLTAIYQIQVFYKLNYSGGFGEYGTDEILEATTVHNDIDKLGHIIKTTRNNNNLTREQLAKKINITPRYLMSIENENKKLGYNVLFNLIRELGISFFLKNYVAILRLKYLSNSQVHNVV